MKKPDYPSDELTRLHSLKALNLLDTLPEERFDRLTRLAKRLFNVPIALVSLIDAERQWFKSRQGIELTETARELSFCAHTILSDDLMIVPDALLDERFHDNPHVIDEPWVRFYAGVPLAAPNNSKVGTFCLIDLNPRDLSEEDQELLRDLGQMAEQELTIVQAATMDDLTLLSNRRGFISLARHALNLCRRLKMPASLFFFDLDKFKDINDCYGHAEGDRALVNFSQLLRDTFRDSDVVGRLGGDEFVALLTNTTRMQSEQILQRLDYLLADHNTSQTCSYSLNYSTGIIEFDLNRHHSINDLLHDADMLMYQQKQLKRQL